MRCTILAIGLTLVCGCGKKQAAGGTGSVEFEAKSSEALSDEYRDDPGGADGKYKGKTGRVPFTGNFEREEGKLVARYARAGGAVRSARQPDLLFRFASDAEAAKLDKRKSYYMIGRCE